MQDGIVNPGHSPHSDTGQLPGNARSRHTERDGAKYRWTSNGQGWDSHINYKCDTQQQLAITIFQMENTFIVDRVLKGRQPVTEQLIERLRCSAQEEVPGWDGKTPCDTVIVPIQAVPPGSFAASGARRCCSWGAGGNLE